MGDTLREPDTVDGDNTEDESNDEENEGHTGRDDNSVDYTRDGNDSSDGDMQEELDNPELCTYLPQIDAITVMGDGLIYAFSGNNTGFQFISIVNNRVFHDRQM